MDQTAMASKMAGEWWADRLAPAHRDKREAFAASVAKRCEAEMREHAARGRKARCCLEVDYDPHGAMLEAVREVIEPECRGMMFSVRGILPQKHALEVAPHLLSPKEGYGNWTEAIPVPDVDGEKTL